MITPKLRTVLFVCACALLAYGLIILLYRMQVTPETLDEQVAYARELMIDVGKGLRWSLFGAFCVLAIALWNSSALTRDWLNVIGFAFKGFGVLLFVLLAILFLRHHQVQKVIQASREAEAGKQREERGAAEEKKRAAEQARERNRDRVVVLLRRMSEQASDPFSRKITIAVAGSQLRDEEVMSLSLAQAVYSAGLYDPDASVRSSVRELLYPIPASVQVDWPSIEHPDFAETVTRLLEKNPDLYKLSRYFRYARVIRSEANDRDLTARLAAVESRSNTELLADRGAATSALVKQVSVSPIEPGPPEAAPRFSGGAELAKADVTARAAVMAASDVDPETQAAALKLLSEATPTRVEEIISSLPPEAKMDLPPRLYIHVAEAEDAKKLAAILQDVQKALLRENRPMIVLQPVWIGDLAQLPRAPSKTEVRYYRSSESALAEKIQSALMTHSIKDVRIYQAKPTEPRDLEGQVEIWFAKDALKR